MSGGLITGKYSIVLQVDEPLTGILCKGAGVRRLKNGTLRYGN